MRCQWQIGMLFGAFTGLCRWVTEEPLGFCSKALHQLHTPLLPLTDSFWLAIGPLWKLNFGQWATKLPLDLSCPSWVGCFWSNKSWCRTCHTAAVYYQTEVVYIHDHAWAGSEDTSKLHAEAAHLNGFYCYNAICCQVCTYSLVGVPYDQLTEEERTKAWFTDVLHHMQASPRREIQYYNPFLAQPWRKDTGECVWNFHSVQNFRQNTWSYILFGRSSGQMCSCSVMHCL